MVQHGTADDDQSGDAGDSPRAQPRVPAELGFLEQRVPAERYTFTVPPSPDAKPFRVQRFRLNNSHFPLRIPDLGVSQVNGPSVSNLLRIKDQRLELAPNELRWSQSVTGECLAVTVRDIEEFFGDGFCVWFRLQILGQVEQALLFVIKGLVRVPPHYVAVGVLSQNILVGIRVYVTGPIVFSLPGLGIEFERIPSLGFRHRPKPVTNR